MFPLYRTVYTISDHKKQSCIMDRIFPRIPFKTKAWFSCCDTEYSGTVTNISENGMFIKIKEMCFPFNSQLEILILLKKEVLKIPVKVCRIIKSTDLYDGIGVEIINSPQNYLEFVNSLRSIPIYTGEGFIDTHISK